MSDTHWNQSIHALSLKSSRLERDTFIFLIRGSYARVIAGLNQELMQADAKTIYRWLHSFTKEAYSGTTEHQFDLRPISIKLHNIPFRYKRSDIGGIIPEDSAILKPGDYRWFEKGEDIWDDTFPPLMYEPSLWSSFAEHLGASEPEELPAQLKLYEIEPSREERVTSRDRACFFTGLPQQNAVLKVAWIIPPAWAHLAVRKGSNPLPFQEDDNAIILWDRLEPHWHNNEFAVDVEDNYRIVRFRKLPQEIDDLLPARLHPTSSDHFLRKHFAWCLRAILQGGDPGEDHSEIAIIRFCQDIGILLLDNRSLKPRPPPDDERWREPIGREILRLEEHGLELFGSDDYDSDT